MINITYNPRDDAVSVQWQTGSWWFSVDRNDRKKILKVDFGCSGSSGELSKLLQICSALELEKFINDWLLYSFRGWELQFVKPFKSII